jgi:hypothetical protein
VAAKQSISDGTRYAAFAAAGFLVLGFLSTLRLNGAGTNSTNATSVKDAGTTAPAKKKS